jgi:hypothetical protein
MEEFYDDDFQSQQAVEDSRLSEMGQAEDDDPDGNDVQSPADNAAQASHDDNHPNGCREED